MEARDYIQYIEEADIPSSEMEELGCTIYSCNDGSYYCVDEDAPKEAHDLASGASQGDDAAIEEIEKD
jgi:hypothetical protein